MEQNKITAQIIYIMDMIIMFLLFTKIKSFDLISTATINPNITLKNISVPPLMVFDKVQSYTSLYFPICGVCTRVRVPQ